MSSGFLLPLFIISKRGREEEEFAAAAAAAAAANRVAASNELPGTTRPSSIPG